MSRTPPRPSDPREGSSTATVVYLCGPPASGKTTIAGALVAALHARGDAVLWLDSDDLRAVLTPTPTYTDDERERFYATIAHLARLGWAGGANVVISATAHRAAWRASVRDVVGSFVEVEVRAPLATLRARDPKGLYARWAAGDAPLLPGVGVEWERSPGGADVVVDTAEESVDEAVARVVVALGGLAVR